VTAAALEVARESRGAVGIGTVAALALDAAVARGELERLLDDHVK
jgi:hypothetical protein